MVVKAKAPAIRFKGFTEAWEQRKAIDIAPLQRGFDLPKNKMKEGDYPVVMSNGINGYHSEFKAKAPGVVTGRSGTIGNLHYIETHYWPHNTALWVTDFKGNIPLYVFYMYQRLGLSRFGTGSGVPTLNRNDVHGTKIYLPRPEEQTSISDFLSTLDNLITLHQRKLCQIATMKARIGWQGLTQKEFLDEGDYYLITGTDFENGAIGFANCHYVGEDRYNQDTNIQIKNYDVLITKDGTIGKVAYVKGLDKPATLNAGVFVLRGKDENIDNLYLYHYLAAPFLLDYADKQATGGTIKHLNQNVLVNFPVPLPTVKEQRIIARYFQELENLITLHQRKPFLQKRR